MTQLVHIVEQLHVLLFSLDEGRHNFLYACTARVLHDRLESLLYDPRISHILFKQAFLLSVLLGLILDTDLEDLDRVRKLFLALATTLLVLDTLIQTFLVVLDILTLLLELLLQLLDVKLKLFLALLVFGLQRQNAIVNVARLSLVLRRVVVRLRSQCLEVIDLTLHGGNLSLR